MTTKNPDPRAIEIFLARRKGVPIKELMDRYGLGRARISQLRKEGATFIEGTQKRPIGT